MHRANEILGAAVKRLGGPESALAWLRTTWPQLVGKAVAEHTRAARLSAGVLEIAIQGKEWRRELEVMKKDFLLRINDAWGSKLVEQVEFVDERPIGRVCHEADNSHTPFIRSRKNGADGKA